MLTTYTIAAKTQKLRASVYTACLIAATNATTEIEMYLIESGLILGAFLFLISWPFRSRLDHSKTLDKAAIALPILWMIWSVVWINLRIEGIVSLPW